MAEPSYRQTSKGSVCLVFDGQDQPLTISQHKSFLDQITWLASEHARLAAELTQSALDNRGLVAEFSRLQKSLETWRIDEPSPPPVDLATSGANDIQNDKGSAPHGVFSLDDLLEKIPPDQDEDVQNPEDVKKTLSMEMDRFPSSRSAEPSAKNDESTMRNSVEEQTSLCPNSRASRASRPSLTWPDDLDRSSQKLSLCNRSYNIGALGGRASVEDDLGNHMLDKQQLDDVLHKIDGVGGEKFPDLEDVCDHHFTKGHPPTFLEQEHLTTVNANDDRMPMTAEQSMFGQLSNKSSRAGALHQVIGAASTTSKSFGETRSQPRDFGGHISQSLATSGAAAHQEITDEMRQKIMSLMARSSMYEEQDADPDYVDTSMMKQSSRSQSTVTATARQSTRSTRSVMSRVSSKNRGSRGSQGSQQATGTGARGTGSMMKPVTKIASKISSGAASVVSFASFTKRFSSLNSRRSSKGVPQLTHGPSVLSLDSRVERKSSALSLDPRLQGTTVVRESGAKENLLFDDSTWKVQNIKTGSILKSKGYLQRFVSAPGAKHRVAWDLLGAALVLYDIIMIPFVQVFDPQEEHWMSGMTWFGAFFWLLDMPKSFFSGFHRRGVVEMRVQKIVAQYVKTWFAFDVTVLLIDWLFLFAQSSGPTAEGGSAMRMMRSGRWLRALRILRACRLIRLARIYRFLNSLMNSFSTELLRVRIQAFVALMGIVVLNHIIACLWYSIGQIKSPNWIEAYGVDQEALAYRYLTALHWATSQCTPATMEVFPVNAIERVFAVTTLVFGLFTFSSFISAITQKMTQLFMLTHDKLCQNVNMRRYFAENSLSLEVTEKVLDFFEFKMHESQRRIHEKDIPILKVLPERIRIQMHVEIFMPCLLWVPFFEFFEELDNTRLRSICHAAVTEQALLPDQELFMKGVQASCVYFINHGRLSYHRRGEECDVENGTWVSEAALWMHWSHRGRMSAVAMSDIFVLDASVFNVFITCCSQTSRTWVYCTSYAFEFANLDNMKGGHSLSDLCHDVESMAILADNAYHKALRHGRDQ